MNILELKQFKKEARQFASLLNHKIRFVKNQTCVDLVTKTIYLNLETLFDLSVAWSALLHESGHIYCYRKNIYPKYHNYDIKTIKEALLFSSLALRAEIYVDKWAEKIYNELGLRKKLKKKYNRTYYNNKTSLNFVKRYNRKLLRLVIGDIYDYNKKNV